MTLSISCQTMPSADSAKRRIDYRYLWPIWPRPQLPTL
jgi:hypothetical protein